MVPLALACLPACLDCWFGQTTSKATGIPYNCSEHNLKIKILPFQLFFFSIVHLHSNGQWRAWYWMLAPRCCGCLQSQPTSPDLTRVADQKQMYAKQTRNLGVASTAHRQRNIKSMLEQKTKRVSEQNVKSLSERVAKSLSEQNVKSLSERNVKSL